MKGARFVTANDGLLLVIGFFAVAATCCICLSAKEGDFFRFFIYFMQALPCSPYHKNSTNEIVNYRNQKSDLNFFAVLYYLYLVLKALRGLAERV